MNWGETLTLLSVIAAVTGAYCEMRLRAREHHDERERQALHHRLDRLTDQLTWASPDVDALRSLSERVAALEARGVPPTGEDGPS